MSPGSWFLVFTALLLAGVGARQALRGLSLWKAARRTTPSPGRGWVAGHAAALDETSLWLSEDRPAWLTRKIELELLPRRGRVVVHPEYRPDDHLTTETSPGWALSVDDGRTIAIGAIDPTVVQGAEQRVARARRKRELPETVRALVDAELDRDLDDGQRFVVTERWIPAGAPVLARGRLDGRELRAVEIVEVGDPRHAVRSYFVWAAAVGAVSAATFALAAFTA